MDPVYRDCCIQKNTAQVEEYGVKQAPFDVTLRTCPTIVKMDIEGSEMPILQQKWGWKGTRLLLVEISVVNLRQEFGPNSWKIFAPAAGQPKEGCAGLLGIPTRLATCPLTTAVTPWPLSLRWVCAWCWSQRCSGHRRVNSWQSQQELPVL